MTTTWQLEYERRLRRVAGVTDDTLAVRVETSAESWEGCETCGDYGVDTTIEIWIGNRMEWAVTGESAFGDLMRELAGVEDE